MVDLQWLHDAYAKDKKVSDLDVAIGVRKLLVEKMYGMVDTILSDIKPDKLTIPVMVSIISNSSGSKDKLPSYELAFKKVESEIKKRKRNPTKLMRDCK